MAISGFQAEATNTGGEIFAVLKTTTDSFVYPVGFTAWGSSASINVTSTSAPFPVTLISGNSGVEVNAAISTASKIQVKNDSADAIFVRGLTSSAITISTDTTITVTGYVAPSTTVTVTNIAANDTVVTVTNPTDTTVTAAITAITTTTGGGALDSTNSAIRVNVVAGSAAGDSTVTVKFDSAGVGYDTTNSALRVTIVSGGDANDTTVTISNDTADPVGVSNDTATPIFVRGLTDSTIPVSGTLSVAGNRNDDAASTAGSPGFIMLGANRTDSVAANDYGFLRIDQYRNVQAAQHGTPNALGALSPVSLALSSLAQTVMTSSGRLYGYSISNPDSATDAWVKFYSDDSAGVTLGTSSAAINVMVPFGGGREKDFGPGVFMSSGLSIAAAATGPSTAHDAPSTTLYITVYYAPSS